jgi:hypothetical protein
MSTTPEADAASLRHVFEPESVVRSSWTPVHGAAGHPFVGKFWMAAWRGCRALTWITGVVAFLARRPAGVRQPIDPAQTFVLTPLWYHLLPGWRNSANVDLIAIYLTGAATVLLLLVPFVPGIRDIPRWIPVHRLIWRDWNRRASGPVGQPGATPEPAGQNKP